ncbi:hypothetical protein [Cryocola sp. 340MFSha3.1]|uniref:hypothetical protein n=1 Tax=Cryocola sp. 340MFSha3.1 TaxID=1169145 RepID=UPI00036CF655|nr:hypothetical protein [Cryocola sp. 340MFSha3.1]
MGDRTDRARAARRAGIGALLALLTLVATVALAVAIPTQGENPRAWGVIVCGLVTVGLCGDFALRNRRLLRHYRGDDLVPPRHPVSRDADARRHVPARQARAKAAR